VHREATPRAHLPLELLPFHFAHAAPNIVPAAIIVTERGGRTVPLQKNALMILVVRLNIVWITQSHVVRSSTPPASDSERPECILCLLLRDE